MRFYYLALLIGGFGLFVDGADEEAPKFNKCNDDGEASDLPRLQVWLRQHQHATTS